MGCHTVTCRSTHNQYGTYMIVPCSTTTSASIDRIPTHYTISPFDPMPSYLALGEISFVHSVLCCAGGHFTGCMGHHFTKQINTACKTSYSDYILVNADCSLGPGHNDKRIRFCDKILCKVLRYSFAESLSRGHTYTAIAHRRSITERKRIHCSFSSFCTASWCRG